MPNTAHAQGLQLRSTVTDGGQLQLDLVEVETPEPQAHEVVVRVDAAPINPSDLALLLGGADVASAQVTDVDGGSRTVMELPGVVLRALSARKGKALPVGNEGAGVVVAAGAAADAQALIGRTVSFAGGASYSQYRCVPVGACLPLPEGTSAAEGASWFVNPMTALGMLETMRLEGHTALVHTAAASNLGQMLQKACLLDSVPLVNIVRRPEQAKLLRELGATYVCDSSADTFMQDLIEAMVATGATLAFDAIGGGELVSQILTAMEVAASRDAASYSRYGSTTYKQAYIYGGLDRSPTTLTRGFGMSWGVGGWLLPNFLQKAGAEVAGRMRTRVAENLKTTFASHYAGTLSLREALEPDHIAVYAKQATGQKYLIVPSR